MADAAAPKKEKKGLSKAWKKFKESFKSKPVTASTSTSAPAKTTPAKSEPSKDTPKPEAKTTSEQAGQSDVDRRLEKARAIFKKYDFEFNDEDWQASEPRPKAPRERVQKQIRMRVKYTCHNCKTVYGHERICSKCQHKRCSECIRYPPKKRKDKAGGKAVEDPAAGSKPDAVPAGTSAPAQPVAAS